MSSKNTLQLAPKFLLTIIMGICFLSFNLIAGGDSKEGEFDVNDMIMHHIADAHEFHIFKDLSLPLPCIVYKPGEGLDVFMSSKFEHGAKTHNGFKLDHGKLASVDGAKFYDFSITKNVFTLFLATFILFFIFMRIAKSYVSRKGKSPKGIQSFFEPIILFIRDEVAKPNIPNKWQKFLPFLMTLFFFILVCNLLGLVPFFPGSANISGNIAFTLTLAVFTLIMVMFNSNKDYWQHILWMPGVPTGIKLLMAPIELISNLVIKPLALAIRLFANITGGHIIILSLISLIFIFGEMGTNVGGAIGGSIISTAFVLFMNAIELFVAFLQAFIFTVLAALYIGEAVAEHEHH